MSMAEPIIKQKRKPQGNGTIVCDKCDAEYSKNSEWWIGTMNHGKSGTQMGQFTPSYKVEKGCCPNCGNKNE